MLAYFTYFLPFEFCRKIDKNSVFFPSYHTVSDRNLPYVKPLYHYRTAAHFEKEIDFLLKHFKPISLFELEGYAAKPQGFHLTFDDGLATCYDIVMPILLKKGVPATFFLNNDFIDNKSLFYRFKATLLLHRLTKSQDALQQVSSQLQLTCHYGTVEKKVMGLDHTDVGMLDALGKLIGLDFQEFLNTERPYMSTAQVHELIRQGFTIGAHSQSHPRYDLLSLNQQLAETGLSIDRLKRDFNIPYTAFAFPFSDFDIQDEFYKKIRDKYGDIQLFGIKQVRPHRVNYYNRYIMELQKQKSPAIALKYLYLKSLLNR